MVCRRGLRNSLLTVSPLPFPPTGKSALHWAAAVNNVDAALALLKNGANKDMQNNKVSGMSWFKSGLRETPDFMELPRLTSSLFSQHVPTTFFVGGE